MEDRLIESESILQAILYKENELFKRKERETVLNKKEASNQIYYIEQSRMMADGRIHGKDHHPFKHGDAVAKLTYRLCTELGIKGIERILITYAAMVHDIGKLDENIPYELLNKKGKLTPGERRIIQLHPIYSMEMIYYPEKEDVKKEMFTYIAEISLFHHERYDGKGYPHHLIGKEIPLGSRIIAITDVSKALTHDRPYRKAYSQEEALNIMKDDKGHFDPGVLKTFMEMPKNL